MGLFCRNAGVRIDRTAPAGRSQFVATQTEKCLFNIYNWTLRRKACGCGVRGDNIIIDRGAKRNLPFMQCARSHIQEKWYVCWHNRKIQLFMRVWRAVPAWRDVLCVVYLPFVRVTCGLSSGIEWRCRLLLIRSDLQSNPTLCLRCDAVFRGDIYIYE